MLIGRFLLIIIMLSTFIIAAITTNITNNNHLLQTSTIDTEKHYEQSELLVVSVSSSAVNENECQEPCSVDYCLKYLSINKNCTKLIRDQCDCCTVCLRSENQTCGGNFNVYGVCEQNLLCYKSNKTTKNLTEQTGICLKGKKRKYSFFMVIYVNYFLVFLACLKFQCLPVIINNKTTCECANRSILCNADLHQNSSDNNNNTRIDCEEESVSKQEQELSFLKATDGKINLIVFQSFIITSILSSDRSSSFIYSFIYLFATLTGRVLSFFPKRIALISVKEVR